MRIGLLFFGAGLAVAGVAAMIVAGTQQLGGAVVSDGFGAFGWDSGTFSLVRELGYVLLICGAGAVVTAAIREIRDSF